MESSIVFARFSAAFVLAFLLGIVRQRLGKPIGFGTFIFVAMGACGLALTATRLRPEDPLPLLSSIVTGIGFLGAGALVRNAERVVGFTSAATIWICAVFGLTIGVGEYQIALLVYGALWTVIAVDHHLERRWFGAHQRKLTVDLRLGLSEEDYAALGLPPLAQAHAVELDRSQHRLSATFSIDRPRIALSEFVRQLSDKDGVLRLLLE